jgi:hypothetical protein
MTTLQQSMTHILNVSLMPEQNTRTAIFPSMVELYLLLMYIFRYFQLLTFMNCVLFKSKTNHGKERESDRNIIFRCSLICLFFLGFHIVTTGNLFYDTKEKEHQKTRQYDLYWESTPPHTNQIASCFDALSVT